MQVPLNFTARDYQAEGLAALDSGVSLAVFCWARRAGKDFTCFSYAVKKMVETPMNVVIVWPTKRQGYDNFWTAIDNSGRPILDAIPKSLYTQRTNSPTDMHITLKNGSTLMLLGASEPDSLRGANGKIYIFSEFVDIPYGALKVIRPIVRANKGQIIIQSTPKIDGISGGTFEIIYDNALLNWTSGKKTQFASLITAERYLTQAELDEAREEAIRENGNDFFYRQEYLCDFGQASSTSYYGAALQLAKEQGRIGEFAYNPAYPCYTAWDLGGGADSTAIVFFQFYQGMIHIIDYYETPDVGDAAIIKFVMSKPYNMAWHFLPHDGSVRDSDAIARINKAHDLGLINASLLRRESKEDSIKRAIERTIRTTYNAATTNDLRRKLMMYKRKFNPLTGDYMGPQHDTNSHAADAVRYVYAAIEQDFDQRTGEYLYSPERSQSTYDGNLVTIPQSYRG